MAQNISTLNVKFTADTAGLKAGAAGAGGILKGLQPIAGVATANMGSLGASIGTLTSAFSAAGPAGLAVAATLGTLAGGAYAAYKGIEQFNASANRIDEQSKLAMRLGLTYDSLQNISFAANRSGVDLATLTKSLEYMSKTIGSGGMNLGDRFAQQLDKLAKIEDPAARYAEGYKIFGRSVGQIIPLVNNLSADMERASRFSKTFGTSISEVDSKNVERMNDAWGDLVYIGSQLADKFVSKFGGPMAAFLESILAVTEEWAATLGAIGVTWDDVGGFAIALMSELNSGLLITNGLLEVQAGNLLAILAAHKSISAFVSGDKAAQQSALRDIVSAAFLKAKGAARIGDVFSGKAAADFNAAITNGSDFSKRGFSGIGGEFGGSGGRLPSALEFGSAGAISAIQSAGGNPLTAVADNTRQMLSTLTSILDLQRREAAEKAAELAPAGF